MYVTEEIRPCEEIWTADRLIDQTTTTRPMAEQMTDHFQLRILTVSCAGIEDAERVVRDMQDSEFHHDVSNNLQPVRDGLNLFKGTVTGKRFLFIGDGQRQPGSYTPNYSIGSGASGWAA